MCGLLLADYYPRLGGSKELCLSGNLFPAKGKPDSVYVMVGKGRSINILHNDTKYSANCCYYAVWNAAKQATHRPGWKVVHGVHEIRRSRNWLVSGYYMHYISFESV